MEDGEITQLLSGLAPKVLMLGGRGIFCGTHRPGSLKEAAKQRQCFFSLLEAMGKSWSHCLILDHLHSILPKHIFQVLNVGYSFLLDAVAVGRKCGMFFLEGTSLLPPSCRALPPHTRRTRLKINGAAWGFNYSSVGRGGE